MRRTILVGLIAVPIAFFPSGSANSQLVQQRSLLRLDQPGTYSISIPAGATDIRLSCWGAGGGGGRSEVQAGGGGGGGGAFQATAIPPGAVTLQIFVGAGGAPGIAGTETRVRAGDISYCAAGSGAAGNVFGGGAGGTPATAGGDAAAIGFSGEAGAPGGRPGAQWLPVQGTPSGGRGGSSAGPQGEVATSGGEGGAQGRPATNGAAPGGGGGGGDQPGIGGTGLVVLEYSGEPIAVAGLTPAIEPTGSGPGTTTDQDGQGTAGSDLGSAAGFCSTNPAACSQVGGSHDDGTSGATSNFPSSIAISAASSALQELTAVCPGTLTLNRFGLFAKWPGSEVRGPNESFSHVPNNHGLSGMYVMCTPTRNPVSDPATTAWLQLPESRQGGGLNFSTQGCPPDFGLRALVTYTRNDVVDYIEVICKNEAGTKFEPYFSRKEIILSASWEGSIRQSGDDSQARPLACRGHPKGMGVMYDGIIREVWLICDPADGQSAIPISQASPSLDAPPPNHDSGVATVVQPEPCVTLRPEPGAGKTPSAGVQVTEVCPEPANPAAVVTTPQPAPSICETNPAACVVQPKAKVIKVPLNEPAEGSTPR